MRQIAKRTQKPTHPRIAWRRAADEWLIAAIFSGTVSVRRDDDFAMLAAPVVGRQTGGPGLETGAAAII